MRDTLEPNFIVVYSDGGSRGNPGPSALGVWIETLGIRFGKYLGTGTNNEAEYAAIEAGLLRIVEEIGIDRARLTTVECRMDSELAMRQLSGRYRVKNPRMQMWFDRVKGVSALFASVRYVHVLREQNKEADAEVNRVLDEQANISVGHEKI